MTQAIRSPFDVLDLSTIETITKYKETYSDLPCEAIIKQDVLRLGLAFQEDVLKVKNYKKKDYFIFSFDLIPLSEQDDSIRFKAPEEIRISGGLFKLKKTVVSVRINPNSPYSIAYKDGKIVMLLHEQIIADEVEFPPIPDFYNTKLSSGKKAGEIAPIIEWGYLIYLTIFRNCQYFGKDEECAFCDINHNYRQQKNEGRPYTGVKSLEDILEVLELVGNSTAKVYTLTGGSVTKTLRSQNETEFYLSFARGIEERFPNKWIGKIVTQAWEKEELIPFHEAGIDIYHPNYEIWDKRLFKLLCPGKERYIGRETWIRRILDAREVFGASYVIPNFVGGIELSKPYGFESVTEAVDSTREGLDFFMSEGIVPRFTTWCPEPYTTLSTITKQTLPPLEYFLELLRAWQQTFVKYKLPVPPGYGEPGAGNAVFSVSAFMDVIDPSTPRVKEKS